MVSAALLICISGLLSSLGLSWHTNYVCKTRDRLLEGLEAPVERVWQGHGGLFRPSTFCRSAATSCSAGFGSNVKTLPMAGTMRCTTRGGTASLARSSGGAEGRRMGSAATSSMSTSEDSWRRPRSQSGTRPWPHMIEPKRLEQSGASISCAETGQGCSEPSWTTSFWGPTMSGTTRSTSDELWTTSSPGTSSARRICSDWIWAGATRGSSQRHSTGNGSNCWSASIRAPMLTQRPGP